MYPYATVMDCMRAMEFLQDFDFCQKFDVRAEIL